MAGHQRAHLVGHRIGHGVDACHQGLFEPGSRAEAAGHVFEKGGECLAPVAGGRAGGIETPEEDGAGLHRPPHLPVRNRIAAGASCEEFSRGRSQTAADPSADGPGRDDRDHRRSPAACNHCGLGATSSPRWGSAGESHQATGRVGEQVDAGGPRVEDGLAHGPHPAGPRRGSGHVHHQVDGRAQVVSHCGQRQARCPLQHHRLEPAQRVGGAVRVARGQRPLVSGVHGLEHVEGLGSPDLADDDAVRAQTQSVAHQIADGHSAHPVGVGRAGFETYDVRVLESELGHVLDRDQAFVRWDLGGQGVEERGLACPRPSDHHDVASRPNRPTQQPVDSGMSEGAQRLAVHGEAADGHHRSVDGERRNDGVDSAAVGESGIHQG